MGKSKSQVVTLVEICRIQLVKNIFGTMWMKTVHWLRGKRGPEFENESLFFPFASLTTP